MQNVCALGTYHGVVTLNEKIRDKHGTCQVSHKQELLFTTQEISWGLQEDDKESHHADNIFQNAKTVAKPVIS